MNLRPYQLEAVAGTFAAIGESKPSALIVLPTGCGKTVTFAEIIKQFLERFPGKRAIVIAHREELIRQAADKIQQITGEVPDIEMAGERADIGMWRCARVIVASKDTLQGKRLARFKPEDFCLIVTDEAHHAVATTYRRIFDHFPGVFHLGVTATPDRTDEEALGQIYETVAYDYELPEAISDGWLCPIHQRSVEVHNLDYSKVRTTAGELNSRDLAEVLSNEEVLQQIADATVREAKGRKTLVFTSPGFKTEGEDSFRVSERMTEILNRHRLGCARLVMGTTPKDERAAILRDYRDGHFQFLVNVGVFTEGFDDPTIEVICMARPTKSRSLYSQIVGRGTRPLPGIVDGVESPEGRRAAIASSKKPYCEVLDFEGNAGTHKLIHCVDILGGNYSDKEIEVAEAKVKKATASGGATVSVADALEAARDEVRRKEAFERMKRAHIIGTAQYSTRGVDPFDLLDVDRPVRRGWDTHEPPSEPQRDLLAKFGIDARGLTKKEANTLIIQCISNRKQGKATFKQQKMLAKYGMGGDITFEEASRRIESIKQNGWRKPAGVA